MQGERGEGLLSSVSGCKINNFFPVTAKKQGKLYDSFEENSSCACKVLIIR